MPPPQDRGGASQPAPAAPPQLPLPAPYDCSSALLSSFAAPEGAKGKFFVALDVPNATPGFCAACGCSLAYALLPAGSSTSYSLSLSLVAGTAVGDTGPTSKSAPGGSSSRLASKGGDGGLGAATASYAASGPAADELLQQLLQDNAPPGQPGLAELPLGSSTGSGGGGGGDNATTTGLRYSGLASAIDAAWQLQPPSSGDVLLRLQVGAEVLWHWVQVDLEPPTASGNMTVGEEERCAAGRQGVWDGRFSCRCWFGLEVARACARVRGCCAGHGAGDGGWGMGQGMVVGEGGRVGGWRGGGGSGAARCLGRPMRTRASKWCVPIALMCPKTLMTRQRRAPAGCLAALGRQAAVTAGR